MWCADGKELAGDGADVATEGLTGLLCGAALNAVPLCKATDVWLCLDTSPSTVRPAVYTQLSTSFELMEECWVSLVSLYQ